MSSPVLSPTTGEPVSVVGRRNRLGVIFLIVADFSGTMALIISYCYLWALNVNNGWAPNTPSLNGNLDVISRERLPWAADWPFWVIFLLSVVATVILWMGIRSLRPGHHAGLVTAAVVSLIVTIATLALQWWQMATFPFDITSGAYASAVFLLTGSVLFNVGISAFLLFGVAGRTSSGKIAADNPWQAKLVGYWMIWVCFAILLGAICTTFLKDSTNANPENFGGYSLVNPDDAYSTPSPSPSGSASPSASASPSGSSSQ